MFGSKIEMLQERRGNRASASIKCEKIKKLGWQEEKSVEEHISDFLKQG